MITELNRLTEEILEVVEDENFKELPLTVYYALEEAFKLGQQSNQ